MAEKERYYCDKFEEIYDNRIDRYPSNEAICHILNNQIERIKNLEQENKQLKQSQKQLAIEELEKVKEYNHTLSLGGSPYIDVFINNQIKELKGEK